MAATRYWHYSQNNSGGSFDFDAERGITHHVVIEAASAEDADRRAEDIGLYFDGEGDCPCCGDRWSSAYGEGDAEPMVYGASVTAPIERFCRWMGGKPEIFVHHMDGRVIPYGAAEAEVIA